MKDIQFVLNIIQSKQDEFIKISFHGGKTEFKKIVIQRKHDEKIYCQIQKFTKDKVFHKNIYDTQDFIENIKEYFYHGYKQADIIFTTTDLKILINKKQMCKIIESKNKKVTDIINAPHNRIKNYIISEGEAVDFLVSLGIMTKDGKVVKDMYKKFKQINRFLEFIDDINEHISDSGFVVDFGCGKSYLTFAIYYYFNIIKNKNIQILGLDLKEDVVSNCNELAKQLNYNKLEFLAMDIKNYRPNRQIDLVISLHACDTATDYAMYSAIKWDSKVILCVPCCQHELNSQITNTLLSPVLEHGILKEKFSSILTDAIRGQLLKLMGYKVSAAEFIDMEHTPKNIMIRGVKKKSFKQDVKKYNDLLKLLEEFNVSHTLYKILKEDNYFDDFDTRM